MLLYNECSQSHSLSIILIFHLFIFSLYLNLSSGYFQTNEDRHLNRAELRSKEIRSINLIELLKNYATNIDL